MYKGHSFLFRAIVISLVSLIAGQNNLLFGESSKTPPLIKEGVLDCSNWDFNRDGYIKLTGEWAFYWDKLYNPADFENDKILTEASFIQFPQLWRNISSDGKYLPNHGFATYRLEILTNKPISNVAFQIPDVYSSYQLWINGQLIAQNGKTGKTSISSYPHWLPKVQSIDLTENVNEIVLQISNFHHSKGGATKAPLFGLKDSLQAKQKIEHATSLLLSGALIMGCLFFLGLYLFGKREKASLYFSLFCFVFCYRVVGSDLYVLHEYFPGLDWTVTTKLEYISLFLSVSFFLEFINKVFNGEFPKWLTHSVHLINGVLTLFTICFAANYYTQVADSYLIGLMGLIIFGSFVLIRAWIHKREGADFAVLSFVILFLTFSISILDYLSVSELGSVISFFGYILFFFFQSLILSRKFSISYQKAVVAAQEGSRIKSDFLATMSHEIRTPMNGMIGMTSLLSQTKLTEEQRKFVDTIRLSGENLMTIINDILDFSKIESQNMELECQAFDLKSAVAEVVELFSLQASKKGISIHYKIEQEVPEYIVGDVTRLKQVIINLVNNAIKFTNEGEINIRIKPEASQANGEMLFLQFEIEDTGIGIEASKTDRLFTPFSQADSSIARKYGGTGLGLAICQKLVHLMGGSIWVESEEEKGTKISFNAKFNSASDQEIDSIKSESKPIKITAEKLSTKIPLRILVVEDNAINLQLVLFILKKEGYIADTAGNGQEAVDAVERQNYDIIFMDMQMPVMDGLEASKRITAKFSEENRPIIIALTANAMKEDREKCFASGMVDFITKPLKPGIVRECLMKWGGKIHAQSHTIIVSN